jgi:dynein heavy chain
MIARLKRELSSTGPSMRALTHLMSEVGDLEEYRPLVEILCDKSLRTRHWTQIQKIITSGIRPEDLILGQLRYLSLHEHLDALQELCEKARREGRLELMLDKMEHEWHSEVLELSAFRDTGIRILQGTVVEGMQLRLDEHIVTTQSILANPDVAPLVTRAETWEQKLLQAQESLDVWQRVQGNFLYLEPVLRAPDIKTTLPDEAVEFERTSEAW